MRREKASNAKPPPYVGREGDVVKKEEVPLQAGATKV
jgi:hypothetical protein